MNFNKIQNLKKIFLSAILILVFSYVSSLCAQEGETDLVTGVEKVAEKVGPTVVSVKTEKTEHTKAQPLYFGTPFQDEFFNQFFGGSFGGIPESEFKSKGLGSGVIINLQGYILTNEHVIEGADKITVALPDGREFPAALKGTDPRSDLAVIKIDAPNLPDGQAGLPIAVLGNSDSLKIGQWVVAIGNPFGNILANPEPTVTAGVISALKRSLPKGPQKDTDYSDLIQTDAAINPGNSGGPLVNLKGEVIGINVAIFSTTGGSQGIGFAIPINDAKLILTQLIEGKEISYGWIGVSVQDIDERLASYFKLSDTHGVLISQVLEGGPAVKGGLKEGDVILAVNGKEVKNVSSLLKLIGSSPVDKKASITILRAGQRLEMPVVVSKRPRFDEFGRIISETGQGEDKAESSQEPQRKMDSFNWRGLTLKNISPEIAGKLNLESTEGAFITEIQRASSAEEAGLRAGDVIISINQMSVKNISEFIKDVKNVKGRCLIRTRRGFFVIEEP